MINSVFAGIQNLCYFVGHILSLSPLAFGIKLFEKRLIQTYWTQDWYVEKEINWKLLT